MKPNALSRLLLLSLMSVSLHGCNGAKTPPPNPIDGDKAYAHVKAMVDLGPRPSGSAELIKCSNYIVTELGKFGVVGTIDKFEDRENAPGVVFRNVEADIAGTNPKSDQILVLGSHYDTKITKVPDNDEDPNMKFVGANDAGSSSGLLIELARYFKKNPLACKLRCVWFDGEENLEWHWEHDHKALFGSRHCVKKLRASVPDGKDLNQIVPVMVLLDMVGAKDLNITRDQDSTPELLAIVEKAAKDLGYEKYFFAPDNSIPVKDDHIPFKNYSIKVVDIIQFGGGPRTKYSPWWHTKDDTMNIISAKSLGIVGHVVTVALPEMVKQFYK